MTVNNFNKYTVNKVGEGIISSPINPPALVDNNILVECVYGSTDYNKGNELIEIGTSNDLCDGIKLSDNTINSITTVQGKLNYVKNIGSINVDATKQWLEHSSDDNYTIFKTPLTNKAKSNGGYKIVGETALQKLSALSDNSEGFYYDADYVYLKFLNTTINKGIAKPLKDGGFLNNTLLMYLAQNPFKLYYKLNVSISLPIAPKFDTWDIELPNGVKDTLNVVEDVGVVYNKKIDKIEINGYEGIQDKTNDSDIINNQFRIIMSKECWLKEINTSTEHNYTNYKIVSDWFTSTNKTYLKINDKSNDIWFFIDSTVYKTIDEFLCYIRRSPIILYGEIPQNEKYNEIQRIAFSNIRKINSGSITIDKNLRKVNDVAFDKLIYNKENEITYDYSFADDCDNSRDGRYTDDWVYSIHEKLTEDIQYKKFRIYLSKTTSFKLKKYNVSQGTKGTFIETIKEFNDVPAGYFEYEFETPLNIKVGEAVFIFGAKGVRGDRRSNIKDIYDDISWWTYNGTPDDGADIPSFQTTGFTIIPSIKYTVIKQNSEPHWSRVNNTEYVTASRVGYAELGSFYLGDSVANNEYWNNYLHEQQTNNDNIALTGGYTQYTSTTTPVSGYYDRSNNTLYMSSVASGIGLCIYCTKSRIDLTNFSKIVADIYVPEISSDGYYYIETQDEQLKLDTPTSNLNLTTTTTRKTVELDISSLTGKHFIQFGAFHARVYIYNAWLE